MSEDQKSLVKAKEKGIEAVVNNLFATKTPKQFIKTRPGPGGRSLAYVEVGYVVSVLNNAFGPFWEWRITDKQVGNKQIWVQGELTIKNKEMSITKTGFGGAVIKISTQTKEPVNVANDLKAASSDALKKAASLFGIASDVFYKEMDILEESPDEINEEADGAKFGMQQAVAKFFAVSAERGFHGEKAKELIKTAFNVKHLADLTVDQLDKGIKGMESKYQIVSSGEEPLKIGELRKTKTEQVFMDGKLLTPTFNLQASPSPSAEIPVAEDTYKDMRKPDDCGNPNCKKGEDGTRAKSNPEFGGFCSKECREEYYPDLALDKKKYPWAKKDEQENASVS